MRFHVVFIVSMCICFAAPADLERLKRLTAVEELLQAGRVAEAQIAFRNLLQKPHSADARTGIVADLLGVALLDHQRYGEAGELLSFSVATLEKIAPDDARVSRTVGHLAEARWAQGHLAEAQSLCERVLVVQSRALQPNDPEILTTLQNLAAIHRERGQYNLSMKYLSDAIAAVPVPEPVRDVWRATVLQDSASLHLLGGKLKAAKETSLRALAILERVTPRHPLLLVSIMTCIGLAEARMNQRGRADFWAERALKVANAEFGRDDVRYAATLVNRATVEEALGLYNLAEQSLRTAAAIQANKLGRTSPTFGRTLLRQSAIFAKLGRNSEALNAENSARPLLAGEYSSESEVSLAQLKKEANSRPRR